MTLRKTQDADVALRIDLTNVYDRVVRSTCLGATRDLSPTYCESWIHIHVHIYCLNDWTCDSVIDPSYIALGNNTKRRIYAKLWILMCFSIREIIQLDRVINIFLSCKMEI